MARNIVDRIGIAKAVAAGAAEYAGLPDHGTDADRAADMCWRVADGIVSRAEAMRAEDIETAKEEAEAAEVEAAKTCRLYVPTGFEGPCILDPHEDTTNCENKAGDKW